MEIMESGKYIKADPELVPPRNSKFLVTLDKTLYRDYINDIVKEVKHEASLAHQNGHLDNDNYLGLIMEKLADGTDSAIKMEVSPLLNATNIFRNARTLIVAGTELIEYLREQKMDYERLERGVDYLTRNLNAAVNDHLITLRRRHKFLAEGHWDPDLVAFEYMGEKMVDLKKRIHLSSVKESFTSKIKSICRIP